MSVVLHGARVFDGESILEDRAVILDGARIRALLPRDEVPSAPVRVDLGGGILSPGFIDIQVNGGGGVHFGDKPTVEAIRRIGAAHRRLGTTGFIPTKISGDEASTLAALKAVRAALTAEVPGLLGIHLEGPWLSTRRAGAHEARKFHAPQSAEVDAVLREASGSVLMTIAPEVVPAAMVSRLAKGGVIVCAGHTEATPEQLEAAREAGLKMFSHLFNAMPPLSGREPGPVGTALLWGDLFASVIVDGHHVHPLSLKLARKAFGPGKLVLITDAMAPVGTDATSFKLGSRVAHVRGGRCELEDGTLAGSCLDMATAVQNAMHALDCPLDEALAMATSNPARLLGRSHEIGAIATGMRADLVHLDDALCVQRTWIGGEALPPYPS